MQRLEQDLLRQAHAVLQRFRTRDDDAITVSNRIEKALARQPEAAGAVDEIAALKHDLEVAMDGRDQEMRARLLAEAEVEKWRSYSEHEKYPPSAALREQATPAGATVECCVPDAGEPSFVFLGRDPQAPALIEAWANERERAEPDSDKPAKAREIAARMRDYKAANPHKGLPASALAQAAPGDDTEREKCARDALLFGAGYMIDGKRIDPRRVQITTSPGDDAAGGA